MSRPGLDDLIAKVRAMTGAGPADYVVAGVTRFSDDHIVDYLDRNRLDLYDEPLRPVRQTGVGGTAVWQVFHSQYGDFEATSGGTAVFVVRQATGTVDGTADWSADYTRGVVTFTQNQAGTAHYLTGRSYDLYGAAADLLDDAARYEKLSFDIRTDNDSLARSQKVTLLTQLAADYRAKQRPKSITVRRGDLHGDD